MITTTNNKAIVRQEGTRVLFIVNGHGVEMSWQAAEKLGRALVSKARLAEELAKAEAIAADDAILLRAGFPLGLTNHPKIRAESRKLAEHDRNLRRYMPGGIRSKVHFGAPTIIQGPPPKEVNR